MSDFGLRIWKEQSRRNGTCLARGRRVAGRRFATIESKGYAVSGVDWGRKENRKGG